jgi:Fic-DOC domain mobile mystery protein B
MNPLFPASDDAQTPLAAEELRSLKLSLLTRAQLNEVERLNINAARIWALSRPVQKRADLATDFFARELHKKMFNTVWTWAGRYRVTERNLGWDWHRIPEGMRVLMDDFQGWLRYKTHSLEEAVVRLHHRMVVIHPWPNGNGRHARLMADVLLAANGGKALTWGAGGNLQSGEVRARYIAALKSADQGDFQPLLTFAKSFHL